jgi:isochorismate hydrolase
MPTQRALPDNNVNWNLHPHRAVLLIHDMQSFFIRPFPAGQSPQRELLENTALLRQSCARGSVPVAYTEQPGSMTKTERGLLADFWGTGMRREPADRAIVESLAPCEGDWRVTKWRYSAFFRSDLLARMRASGRDQLIVCGVYAHVGVLITLVDAFSHDIQPFLVADGVADFSADYHYLALRYAAQRCARVQTTAWVMNELERVPQPPVAQNAPRSR